MSIARARSEFGETNEAFSLTKKGIRETGSLNKLKLKFQAISHPHPPTSDSISTDPTRMIREDLPMLEVQNDIRFSSQGHSQRGD